MDVDDKIHLHKVVDLRLNKRDDWEEVYKYNEKDNILERYGELFCFYTPDEIIPLLNCQKDQIDQLKLKEEVSFALDYSVIQREVDSLNNLYKNHGFDGVVNYAKVKLENYGGVKEENDLICMYTGGWSDNEFFIRCLNFLTSMFANKHYVGYLRGGAFYYSPEPHDSHVYIARDDCDKYEEFLKEQKRLKEKIEKGDLTDFNTLEHNNITMSKEESEKHIVKY